MANFTNRLTTAQLVICCILGTFFCGMTATFIYASRHVSKVTDRDYYVHGLDYSKDSQAIAKGAALGWQLTTRLNRDQLEVRVSDAQGLPVSGGTASFIPSVTEQAVVAPMLLTEQEPGVFRQSIPPVARNLRGQISFKTATAALSSKVVIFQ
jgi:nitrogen fixation protein FixH